MPLDFPASPVVNQTYTGDNGVIYVWNGTAWKTRQTTTTVNIVHTGTTPPSSPLTYPIWWNTDLGRPFFYYSDGTSAQWVDFVPPTSNASTPAYVTRVQRSTDTTITNITWTALSWDVRVRDDLGAHSSVNPTRITVPNGITYARFTASPSMNQVGSVVLRLQKNGTGTNATGPTITKLYYGNYFSNGNADLDSGWIPVVPGDHFELYMYRDAGDGLLLGPQPANNTERPPSWFQAEFRAPASLPIPTGYLRTTLRRASDQSIANNTWTVVTWDVEEMDDGNTHSNSSNTSRITVPAGVTRGRITFNPVWATTGASTRYISIQRNSAGTHTQANSVGGVVALTPADVSAQTCTTGWINVVPGDHYEAYVYQNSGGALNLNCATGSFAGTSSFQAEFT